MPTDSGLDFPTKIPNLSENANIQTAQQELLYGTSDPNSVRGTLVASSVADSTKGLVGHINATVNPTGSVIAFAGSTAPVGWVLCNGDPFDKTVEEFANLFAVINYSYGGSGNLFNVPNLMDRSVLGATPTSLADTGGTADINMPNHVHTIVNSGAHSHRLHAGDRTYASGSLNAYVWAPNPTGTHVTWHDGDHSHTMNNPTNGTAPGAPEYTNYHPYVALNYIIRL